jgi:tRNA(fMet)-specific endonuclease VapC
MLDYLLDTDICIYVLKARNPALLQRFKANDGRMAVSDVTLFELCHGAEKYADPAARLAVIESFLARLDIVPFESHAARHAGQIRAALERAGQGIGSYDLMIAAIARSRGLALATRNTREFNRVEGLRVEAWV